MDKPQDTKFYDWILVDPKDEPYAAFQFHYRSWEHLQVLQLIPPSHPRTLLKPSNSFALLAGHAEVCALRNDNDKDEWETAVEDEFSDVSQGSSPREPVNSTRYDASVFGEVESNLEYDNRQSKSLAYNSQLRVQRQSHAKSSPSELSTPRTTLDGWLYGRPLPKLPRAKPSFDHSRRSSTSSNAPSITPSLNSWFERDLNDPSPEPVIKVAAIVPLLRSRSQITNLWCSDSFSDMGADNDAQLLSSQFSSNRSDTRRSTESTVLSPGMITKKSMQSGPPSTTRLYLVPTGNDDGNKSIQTHRSRISISPSESEWLSRQRVPSPVKRETKHDEKTLPLCPIVEEGIEMSEPAAFRIVSYDVGDENWNRNYHGKENQPAETKSGKRNVGTGRTRNKSMYSSTEWI